MIISMNGLKNRILLIAVILMSLAILPLPGYAFWIWTRESGKWVNPKYTAKETAEEQFRWAESFFKKGDYKRAIAEYKKILKKFAESPYAARAELALGQTYYAMNKFDEALNSYQKVIDNYPHSEAVKKAVESEEKLARDFSKKKPARQFLIPQHLRYSKAGEIYQQIVDNFPWQERAGYLQYKAGWAYYKAGDIEKAAGAFKKAEKNYPESGWAAESSFMLGVLYWKQCPENLQYHQDAINKSIESFQGYVENYPGHHKVEEAKKYLLDLKGRQGEYLFNVGEYYYKKEGALEAASIYYEKLVKKFKETPWAEKARERLLEIDEIKKRIKEGTK